ncbi:MAG: acetyl-CoA carboxylase biotin carboxylase subunit [Actinomycetota bacterium]|nr:acetyl-CoA carboxylase biotin carboxylase subunit [Actinomycetota bacterium]MDQ2981429.1 acetyl-CoA carboxylase biotin carboxylase subunit [Actinomycetota bacterium]
MAVFSKVLVANRGEIAIRVFRTLRELGIGTVAVYSDVDRNSAHVTYADEAYLIGGGPPAESYLNQERILDAARRAGAEAVHPGYGFLAENAAFARACGEQGLVWIGPPPEAIEAMGSKIEARERMRAAGVPIIPGVTEPVESAEEVRRLGDELGWPIAIKASAGGGGKGLKVVRDPAEVERSFESARREGEAYFSDPAVYVERYLEDPRHVEVQVLADAHGNVIHLGERDCTIQRRHQKLVEETPSPAVDNALRERIGAIAVDAARAVGYQSAGTIEGLLSRDGDYFFLEMNTRIQVEHTVTEMVTGLDLVCEQVLIAAGQPLSVRQEDVHLHGHSLECRINAEDVSNGFLPAPGTITRYREPGGPGVRVDSGVVAGSEISPLYDPMIAKLVVHGVDREQARRRMLRALDEFVVDGVKTLIGFHKALLTHPCFVDGETCHGLVESELLAACAAEFENGRPVGAAELGTAADVREAVRSVEVDGRRFEVRVLRPEPAHAELGRRRRERARGSGAGAGLDAVVSPMQGTVLAVEVADGDDVEPGQVLCIVEAMKMENEVHAHRAGRVTELSVAPGQQVTTGQVICLVTTE